ncbi:MAG: hypothetical protein NT007_12760 [Candidatus Kapabacteria bacterium]|nr:hypothetical protein [Candidatus Kapabacteria bacterium]
MKKLTLVLFSLCLVLLLPSCKSALLLTDLTPLKKHMPLTESRQTLGDRMDPKETIEISEIPNKKVVVDVYPMSNGAHTSFYFIAYVDDKLVYWGYPYEFGRHKDEMINKIGEIAWKKFEDK